MLGYVPENDIFGFLTVAIEIGRRHHSTDFRISLAFGSIGNDSNMSGWHLKPPNVNLLYLTRRVVLKPDDPYRQT